MPSKSTLAVFFIPAVLLLIPLVAMHYTDEVDWSPSDFLIMYALMTSVGGVFKFIASRSGSLSFRIATAVACGAAFLLTWANLAVEIIGDDNPVNALYLLVPLVGLIGAGATRCAPRGLARTAFFMAAVMMLIPVVAVVIDRNNFSPGVLGVFVLNGIFASLFVFAGLLFQHVARQQVEARA